MVSQGNLGIGPTLCEGHRTKNSIVLNRQAVVSAVVTHDFLAENFSKTTAVAKQGQKPWWVWPLAP